MGTKDGAELDMKGRIHTCFRRISRLFTGSNKGQYDLKEAEKVDQRSKPLLTRVLKHLKLQKRQKTIPLNEDELFFFALFQEGLLQDEHYLIDNYNEKSRNKTRKRIVIVQQYPVLTICYGFRDRDFQQRRIRQKRGETPSLVPDMQPETCVMAGLNRVLMEDENKVVEEEYIVDNIPASLWLDCMEPAFQLLLLIRADRRNNRTNITRRRKPSKLHRNIVATIGDVQHTYFNFGPQFHRNQIHHPRAGIVALFTNRMIELGERHRRIGRARTDTVLSIPTTVRNINHGRTRATRVITNVVTPINHERADNNVISNDENSQNDDAEREHRANRAIAVARINDVVPTNPLVPLNVVDQINAAPRVNNAATVNGVVATNGSAAVQNGIQEDAVAPNNAMVLFNNAAQLHNIRINTANGVNTMARVNDRTPNNIFASVNDDNQTVRDRDDILARGENRFDRIQEIIQHLLDIATQNNIENERHEINIA